MGVSGPLNPILSTYGREMDCSIKLNKEETCYNLQESQDHTPKCWAIILISHKRTFFRRKRLTNIVFGLDNKVRSIAYSNTSPFLLRVSYLEVEFDNDPVPVKTRNSGLCISTGTGSTSWTFNINKLTHQVGKKNSISFLRSRDGL